jgi:regulator of PEP synthase PpsR (kinase-PPPase family)
LLELEKGQSNMTNNISIHLYLISDSAGETAMKTAHADMAQFPQTNFIVHRKNFVRSLDILKSILTKAKQNKGMIIHTLTEKNLQLYVNDFCQKQGLFCQDLLLPAIKEITQRTGLEPTRELGAQHRLNENYFKRIKAIEFAVKYDDGKDPQGFLKADIVILGVSRTSKTPLSLFLANKNIRVANLPISPHSQIPDQIWQVTPNKVVGLTNDPGILKHIREERMKSYGLDPDTDYSNIEKIKEELQYANKIYDQIGCIVINVAKLSIEETAVMILDSFGLKDLAYS